MDAKIPQQSSPRHGLLTAATIFPKVTQKTAHKFKGSMPLFFMNAHIQLAGNDLANNHTFKLLSGLLRQTFSIETISPSDGSVNVRFL